MMLFSSNLLKKFARCVYGKAQWAYLDYHMDKKKFEPNFFYLFFFVITLFSKISRPSRSKYFKKIKHIIVQSSKHKQFLINFKIWCPFLEIWWPLVWEPLSCKSFGSREYFCAAKLRAWISLGHRPRHPTHPSEVF